MANSDDYPISPDHDEREKMVHRPSLRVQEPVFLPTDNYIIHSIWTTTPQAILARSPPSDGLIADLARRKD